MTVFRAIVFSALLAGSLVGAAISVVQQFGTVPLILKAETYERGAFVATPAVSAGDHSEHEHARAAWQPQDGLERTLVTAATNILTAVGFSLLLAGFYALRTRPISWREGFLWGVAGFAVFTFAPGLGLPPELPGAPAAPLGLRQLWWIATAAATACAIGLFVFRRSGRAAVLACCLLVGPHAIGAPHPAEVHTGVPEALSYQFVVAATLTSLLFWLLLGPLTGYAHNKFTHREPAA